MNQLKDSILLTISKIMYATGRKLETDIRIYVLENKNNNFKKIRPFIVPTIGKTIRKEAEFKI